MTRNRLKGSIRSLRNHLDPEKEEQLKWLKAETEKKVGKILHLAKSISDNKDGDSKEQSELIHLIEEVHRRYESLHYLYENLRVEVKNNFRGRDRDRDSSLSPTSASDSEAYFSADESNRNTDAPNTPTDDTPHAETSGAGLTLLKDKLTSSSKVKDLRSQSATVAEILKQHAVRDEESESMQLCLPHVEELKGEVARLKVEKERLCVQKEQLEDKLNLQIREIEEWLSHETDERSHQLKRMVEQMDSLQKELLSVNSQKAKLEFKLENQSIEASECLLQIENLTSELIDQALSGNGRVKEKERFELHIKDLDKKFDSSSSKKLDLEEQIAETSHEAHISEDGNQELQRKLSELQASQSECENELSAQQTKFEACSAQIKSLIEKLQKNENTLEDIYNERDSLQAEVDTLRDEKRQHEMELEQEKQRESQLEKINTELTNKIAAEQKTMLELGDAMDKLKSEQDKAHQSRVANPKLNFHAVERKMEERAGDIRNEFEAKCKILSRRIKLAEQLQVEHKEWWQRTKEMYEEKTQELKEWTERSKMGITNIKDMSMTTNDLLISLDRVALRFDECTANFLNRISKASCELKFIQEWAMRKNKALLHAKNELDCLLPQLDEKEGEIIMSREKVWKSENKMRELEKMVKKNEDGLLSLEEEKREAIRQLCVWIDYHRSRSDYYKKMLSEMYPGGRRKA